MYVSFRIRFISILATYLKQNWFCIFAFSMILTILGRFLYFSVAAKIGLSMLITFFNRFSFQLFYSTVKICIEGILPFPWSVIILFPSISFMLLIYLDLFDKKDAIDFQSNLMSRHSRFTSFFAVHIAPRFQKTVFKKLILMI